MAPPLVLVNGVGGAVLRAMLHGVHSEKWWCETHTSHYETVWLNLEKILPFEKDCLMHNLILHFDNRTKTYANTTGVLVDASYDFGGVKGIDF